MTAGDRLVSRIDAPWSGEIVRVLNRWQAGHFPNQPDAATHPFTCGADSHDGPVALLATPNGWICNIDGCDYVQTWAHDFMAGGELGRRLFLLPGHEQAEFDPVDLYESHIDPLLDEHDRPGQTWEVEEYLVHPPQHHFPDRSDLVEHVLEHASENEMGEDFEGDYERVLGDPEVLRQAQALLDLMASKINYRMCGEQVGTHTVSLPDPLPADGEPYDVLWDGQPLYASKPADVPT